MTTGLATLLRRLRHDAGLSMPVMADRLGVSERTLSHYELGSREPPHPVLESYLRLIPGLRPADLLLGGDHAWPRWSADAWPAMRDALGYVVGHVTVSARWDASGARHEATEVRGVRPLDASIASPAILTALARAACDASPPRLRVLVAPAPGDETTFVEGRRRHSVRLEEGHPPELHCSSATTFAAGSGEASPFALHHDVVHPVERLTLKLDPGRAPPPGTRPALLAWPTAIGADPSWNVAPVLLPGAEVAEREGSLEASVPRPLVGLRCSVGWFAKDQACDFPPPQGATVGERLRALRRARGMSLRDAAARLGDVSHVTVRNAENGLDVAHSTLRSYLRAFPELAPHELLAGGATEQDEWTHVRDAFGLCAEEIVKKARVEEDGRAAVTVRTSRLRRLRPGGTDLELRHGGILGVFQASPHALQAIIGSPEARIVRGHVGDQGVPHHLFRFQRHEVEGGLSFTVKNALGEAPQFSLLTERVRADVGPGPHYEGTSHWVRFPCGRLRISVSLPRGFRPARVVGHVCPWRVPPEVDLPRLSARQQAPAPVVRERNGALTVSLTVERPLVGFKYGLAWQLG